MRAHTLLLLVVTACASGEQKPDRPLSHDECVELYGEDGCSPIVSAVERRGLSRPADYAADIQSVDVEDVGVVGFMAPVSFAGNLPGVGPAYVVSFPVNCADSEAFANAVVPTPFTGAITTPAVGKIKDPFGGSMISYTCQNTSTTLVQVGDKYTVDPDTTRRGPIYCATNCPSQEWGGNAKLEYCRGATDTTVYCRALVSYTVEP